MKVVTPEAKTTLMLNKYHQAFSFCSARAALRHVMTDKARGIDASGSLVSWTGTDRDASGAIRSSLSWYGNRVEVYEDQPALRSAPDPATGEERRWAIPTILVCNRNFGIDGKKARNISLRTLYNLYKGICVYCYEKIPFHVATKDHCFPKSKGGSNDDFNLVLACKECNNRKDNMFPFFDINGEIPKPKKTTPFAVLVESTPVIRPEWYPYLHIS